MRSVIAEASSSNSNGVPVASLAQGAVWWQPPAVALRAAADAALKEPVISSAYNDDMGLPELRAALLRKCERDHGLREKEHAAMVSAGANLAVSALALALLDSDSSSAAAAASNDDDDDGARNKRTRKKKNNNRKDAAVLFPPYYFNAKMAVQLAGAEVVLGRSDPETWLPDVGWLEERLREEDEDEEDAEREEAEAEEAEAAIFTALRRWRRRKAGLLGSKAGAAAAAALLLVEGDPRRAAVAAGTAAGEARGLAAARRCMAGFFDWEKEEGQEEKLGRGSELQTFSNRKATNETRSTPTSLFPFRPHSLLFFLTSLISILSFASFAFSFSAQTQNTMFALKSSAASRAAVVAPRRQVRTGRAGRGGGRE